MQTNYFTPRGIGTLATLGSKMISDSPFSQYSSGLAGVGNAAGVLSGLQRQGGMGYGSALANIGQLAGRTGALGQYSNMAGKYGGALGSALGIAQGIKTGGFSGYTGAGINAVKLGSNLGMLPAQYGQYANWAAIPLNLYNEVKNWQSGATGQDALGGAATGASIGTAVMPGIGTAVGALLGGAAGALSSVFGNGRVDPENANWKGYTGEWDKLQQQAQQAHATPQQLAQAQGQLESAVQNPYGVLAGYFDLRDNQVKGNNPLYAQYGRMGEEKFTNDLAAQLDAGLKSGKIKQGESASDVYNQVIQPWENSWGRGASTDSNTAAMQGLLTQMTNQYLNNTANQNWRSVGGDQVFHFAAPQYQTTITGAPVPGATQPTQQTTTPTQQVATPRVGIGNLNLGDRPMLRKKGGAIAQCYDDGGDVSSLPQFYDPGYDYGNTVTSQYGPDVSTPTPISDPALQTPDINYNLNDPGSNDYLDSSGIVNQQNDPYGYGITPDGSSGSNYSGANGLAGLLKAYGPLLPLLAGVLNKPKTPQLPAGMSSNAITQPPIGHFARAQNMNPSNNAGSTPMSQQDWYTYGQRPEAAFYGNNQVPLNQSVIGQAKGGKTPTPYQRPGAIGQSTGVPEFNSAQQSYVDDDGSGDGQEDNVDAKLSPGEYVFDAHTVSMAGNGSNKAGAQRLDELRANLRKHAAKSNSKGKQFMHAKPLHQYMPKAKGKKPVASDDGEG